MGTATLRPNGITLDDAGWVNTGGAASKNAALSDNSDSTYVSASGTFTGDGSGQFPFLMRFDLTTFAFPALSQIRSVQSRLRMQNTAPTVGIKGFIFGVVQPGAGSSPARDGYVTTGAGFSTIAGSVFTTEASGGPWTQAIIDSLTYELMAYYDQAYGSISPNWQAVEAYVDVVYNEAPVVVVTGPTEGSTITTTTRPTITWTYSDPEADAQERYRARIFSAAQYGIGGFDPNTSPYTWDSGVVYSSATSFTLPVDLANGTYRVYVLASDVGSGGRASNWDNNTFTINVVPPPAPQLTLISQTTNATGPRKQISIQRTSDVTPTTYMVIEYSDNGGTTWATLRGAGNIVNSPDGTTFVFYDYESPPRQARLYRAKSVRTVPPDIAGPYTSSFTSTLTPPSNRWWLKDIVLDTYNIGFPIEDLTLTPREEVGVFDGLGRTDPATSSDGRKGWEISCKARVDTQAEFAKIDAILQSGRTLLLQDGAFPRQWYVKYVSSGGWEQIRATDPAGTYPVRWLYRIDLKFVTSRVP